MYGLKGRRNTFSLRARRLRGLLFSKLLHGPILRTLWGTVESNHLFSLEPCEPKLWWRRLVTLQLAIGRAFTAPVSSLFEPRRRMCSEEGASIALVVPTCRAIFEMASHGLTLVRISRALRPNSDPWLHFGGRMCATVREVEPLAH